METLDKTRLPEKNKEQLLADQERLKSELEDQFDSIKGDAADVGRQALMIGGAIYLTYKLFKFVTRDKPKKKVDFDPRVRPVVIKKEEYKGPGWGMMLTQQVLTVGLLFAASRLKKRF